MLGDWLRLAQKKIKRRRMPSISSGRQELSPEDTTPGDPVTRPVKEESRHQAGLLTASCSSGQR